MTVDQAKAFAPDAEVGDLVETEQLDGDVFGRIGAQTAKQIVLQRIREVERDQVFDQFASREGELITGTVNRVEPRGLILDVGKNVEAVLRPSEQSALEHYRIGQNVKAYVLEVRRATRGPEILVSRTHKGFLKRLFELEVPEIHSGTVEIKAIAREAGSRSKVAVASRQDGLDPVGATVGQRGARVQAVVAELSGEKIDVIPWNDDPAVFVANALSPAQVISVDIDEEHRIASVTVPERMLSLAIGREGQNARLAARLTGWRIDIRSDVSVAEAKAATPPTRPPRPPSAATAAGRASPTDAAAGEAEARDEEGRRRRRGCSRGRGRHVVRPRPMRPSPSRRTGQAEARRRRRPPPRRRLPSRPPPTTLRRPPEPPPSPPRPSRSERRRRSRRHRGGVVVARAAAHGAAPRGPPSGRASPVARCVRSVTCGGSSGRRTAASSSTRPGDCPVAARMSATTTPASTRPSTRAPWDGR